MTRCSRTTIRIAGRGKSRTQKVAAAVVRGAVVAVLAGFLVSCGGEPQLVLPDTPTPSPAAASPPAQSAASPGAASQAISDATWTTAIDSATGAPTDSLTEYPANAPQLLVAIRATGIEAGSTIEANWFYNNTPLESFTTRHTFADPVTEQWLGFHLDRAEDTPWPTGNYEIRISLNGEPVAEATAAVNAAT